MILKWCGSGVKTEEKIDKWKKMVKMKRKGLHVALHAAAI